MVPRRDGIVLQAQGGGGTSATRDTAPDRAAAERTRADAARI